MDQRVARHSCARIAGLTWAVLIAVGCSSGDEAPPSAASTTVAPSSTTTIPPSPTPPPDPYADLPLIASVSRVDGIDGPRLVVVPTEAGRYTTTPENEVRAWQEILAADPGAETPGMYDQFRCHWVWARLVAPRKPSWNLEPWRPDVGYSDVVAANCNPGGPER